MHEEKTTLYFILYEHFPFSIIIIQIFLFCCRERYKCKECNFRAKELNDIKLHLQEFHKTEMLPTDYVIGDPSQQPVKAALQPDDIAET